MRDADCIAFLQWALPQMGFRWPGFRKVRRQVCKRIARRLRELGVAGLEDYRRFLAEQPDEWQRLDDLCRITISRFYRDKRLWTVLEDSVLPALVGRLSEDRRQLCAWSAGCGAGEEPYTLALTCRLSHHAPVRNTDLRIVATDTDSHQLRRARSGVYPAGCLRDLPQELERRGFEPAGEDYFRLRDAYREGVELLCQDVRRSAPAGPFQLILCRNLAFTYFAEAVQEDVLARLLAALSERGVLVIGSHEQLPATGRGLRPWLGCREILHRPG
jgi:chemotaxis protein methyltransferase CheR